jgi:hypothetical protein
MHYYAPWTTDLLFTLSTIALAFALQRNTLLTQTTVREAPVSPGLRQG